MRRRTVLSALVLACAAGAASSQTTLYLGRSEDISTLSSASQTTYWVGNNPSAVAFDGLNVYVGGWVGGSVPAGVTWNTSIVKLNPFTFSRQFSSLPLSRQSNPTNGYVGMDWDGRTGLLATVDDRTAGGAAGQMKVFPVTGTPVIMPFVPSAIGRVGCSWDFGPTGNGVDYTLDNTPDGPVAALMDFGLFGPFGLDPATLTPGPFLYGSNGANNGPQFNTAQPTEWRDIDIDPRNGTMVGRANNALAVAFRNADGTTTPAPYGRVIPPGGESAFVVGRNAAILHGYAGADTAVWNDRPSGGAGQSFFGAIRMTRLSDGANVPITFLRADGSPADDTDFPTGNALYDFAWDEASGILVICDFTNRRLYYLTSSQPTTGACCTGVNSCVVSTPASCALAGGTFRGFYTSCSITEVCPTGACCLEDNTCIITIASGCAGEFTAGISCSPDPCAPPSTGACCTGTTCAVIEAASCTGTFAGAGSVCEFPGNPVTCCHANFNGVGGVSVQDIYDFLADWSSQIGGGPILIASADFNGVGGVTVQDIYDFLAAWSAGCPG